MKKKIIGITLFLFLMNLQILFSMDAGALLKRVDSNLFSEGSQSYRKLINEEPNGNKKEFVFFAVKKGKTKLALLYLTPASEKGRATLRVDDNMWLYIPNVGKPIRITSLQSITGGIFNNSDIMQLDYSEEYNASVFEENAKEYILELKAKNKSIAYDKLKMWVEKKNELPTKIECYSTSGMLLKTLEFKDIKAFDKKYVRPAVIESVSPLYKGYKSTMIFSDVKLKNFSDEIFSLNFLSKLESLRK